MGFEKVTCMAIYIVKMGVWNDLQTMWDLFQTSALMQKTCIFYVSRTLHACVRLGLRAHVSRLHAQANSYMHMLRASLALFFKNRFIYSLKITFLIFTFLKSI